MSWNAFSPLFDSFGCRWWIGGYVPTQPSFLDILTFFRLSSLSPWLEWGSHPTAAQWRGDELFLGSTLGLCRKVGFSLCSVASNSLWISVMGWLLWPWQLTCVAQKYLWVHENQKVLWNRVNKHLLRALEFPLILLWHTCSLKSNCHTDDVLWSAIAVPLFNIPWYLYKNRFVLIASQKTSVTLEAIKLKVVSSKWI